MNTAPLVVLTIEKKEKTLFTPLQWRGVFGIILTSKEGKGSPQNNKDKKRSKVMGMKNKELFKTDEKLGDKFFGFYCLEMLMKGKFVGGFACYYSWLDKEAEAETIAAVRMIKGEKNDVVEASETYFILGQNNDDGKWKEITSGSSLIEAKSEVEAMVKQDIGGNKNKKYKIVKRIMEETIVFEG